MNSPIDSRQRDLANDVNDIQGLSAVPQILKVVSASTGLRFAAVARVTKTDWVACAVRDGVGLGLSPGSPLDVTTTLCDTVRDLDAVIVMDDAPNDPDYADHRTPKMFGFRSYISVPIHSDGEFFGTLCALDPEPAPLKNEKVVELFELLADVIGQQLGQERAHREQLREAEQRAALREEFIAVLGHDLRSPLAAITMSAHALRSKDARDAVEHRAIERIANSATRIGGLVDDVMDFARARLGTGIEFDAVDIDLRMLLHRIVDERVAASPGRSVRIVFDDSVDVDAADSTAAVHVRGHAGRLAQVAANLIGNALEHSQPNDRVTVVVSRDDGHVVVDVFNEGTRIDDAVIPTLFQPFFRGRSSTSRRGLGLGLYIAAEIVKAHGGNIDARSDDDGTTFSFRLPCV